METMKKLLKMAPGEESGKGFRAVITTSDADREGEVLLPDGMISTDFDKNPVVFWAHDYKQIPIGRCTELSRKSESWEAWTEIASPPDGYPDSEPWLPNTIYALIKQGVINGVSVGFLPVESRKPTPKDRERWGNGIKAVYSKWKLLEYSVTPMPCNQNALIAAVKSLGIEKQKLLIPGMQVIDPVTPVIPPIVETPIVVKADDSPRKVCLLIQTKRAPTEQEKRAALARRKFFI